MTADQGGAFRQAIDWHLRLDSADSAVWHAFTDWLEADEAHRDAYDRVAMDDSLLTQPLAGMAEVPTPVRSRRIPALVAMAAAVALAFTGTLAFVGNRPATVSDGHYIVASGHDGPRSIALADGSRIDLNRDTRLILDRADPRFAILDRGQAVFRIRHDPGAPFRVQAGSVALEDIGTVFDVVHVGDRLDVSVAEGGVVFQPKAEAITLRPGMALQLRGQAAPIVGHVPVSVVGGWRQQRIEAHDMALADVAEDAARMAGTAIIVDPAIAKRRFSGTLRSDMGAADLVANLAALTDTKADRRAGGWILTADAR